MKKIVMHKIKISQGGSYTALCTGQRDFDGSSNWKSVTCKLCLGKKKQVNSQYPTNRQDSTYDQLKTVYDLAHKAGCYDAADAIKEILIDPTTKKLKENNLL